jgi:hypothetical protein
MYKGEMVMYCKARGMIAMCDKIGLLWRHSPETSRKISRNFISTNVGDSKSEIFGHKSDNVEI